MQRLETRIVRLEAPQDVEVRPGRILPAGFYTATEKYRRLEPIGGGQDRTASRYMIEVTPDRPDALSQSIDVTEFVKSGQLIVA